MDIFVRLLNPLLMIALPVALGIFLARRLKVGWRLFGVGAATFIASQVFHIPFNRWLLEPALDRWGLDLGISGWGAVGAALLVGLSAGVFEETARYLVLRRWAASERTWRRGLMFGAGHGGVEALLVGALALLAFFQAVALRNADLSAVVPPEQLDLARSQLEQYWSAPWTYSLLGAVERFGALGAHLGLAITVLLAVRRRNPLWLVLAIGGHAALNAGALLILPLGGPFWTEAYVVGFGLLSLAWAIFQRRLDAAPADRQPPAAASEPPPSPVPLTPTSDKLEDSRYV